jgi:hypothetical protein
MKGAKNVEVKMDSTFEIGFVITLSLIFLTFSGFVENVGRLATMVARWHTYFQTKNRNLGKFWSLQLKMLVHFTAIWCTYLLYGNVIYFCNNLVCEKWGSFKRAHLFHEQRGYKHLNRRSDTEELWNGHQIYIHEV